MKKQRGIFVLGIALVMVLMGAAAHTGYLTKEREASYAQSK